MSYEERVRESQDRLDKALENKNLDELDLIKMFLKHQCLLDTKEPNKENRNVTGFVVNYPECHDYVELQFHGWSISLGRNGKWILDGDTGAA